MEYKRGDRVKLDIAGCGGKYSAAIIGCEHNRDPWVYWVNLIYSGERIPLMSHQILRKI